MPDLCTRADCLAADSRPHSHLALPDPCPHITRLDIIRARLSTSPAAPAELDRIDAHLRACRA